MIGKEFLLIRIFARKFTYQQGRENETEREIEQQPFRKRVKKSLQGIQKIRMVFYK